ncbi:calcium-binding protein [Streptomyces uncialis]|uniref:calcium-binding protein n=1 Tax=Streptomyces uncialis TaxID=1048205 RepID=UPI0033E6674D
MRTRVLAGLTTGALALTALTGTAAQADDRASASRATPPKITKVTVNGGKDLVVGVSKKTFTIKVTAKDDSGILIAFAALWRGGTSADNPQTILVPDIRMGDCVRNSGTTSTCTLKAVADPKASNRLFDLTNAGAGKWHVAVGAEGIDGSSVEREKYGTHRVKRAAKLTADATPEPVRRGDAVTVSGSLTRADWNTHKYNGVASSAVKLQFKKKGTSTWRTVKTVKADSRGKVRTTTKPTADGDFRLSYPGTSTTAGVTSKADFVDVR